MSWSRARAMYCRSETNPRALAPNCAVGFVDLKMRKQFVLRLVAVALILSVGLFAMQTAGHWHGHASDEQHCQVCHIGHVAVPQPTARIALLAPMLVGRFADPEEITISCETLRTHRIPRAPPV